MRLHSVSIYDSQGNVLWLSEGALGPDEHSLVLEALETLTGAASKHCCENKLEDGRIAAFLAVRAPQGHLVGLAMILADLKSGGEGLMDRIMSAPTRTVMQKLAVLLRPAGPRKPDADPTSLVLSLAPADIPVAAPEPPPAVAPAPARTPSAAKTDVELTPRAVNDILEFELTDAPILTPARQAAAVTGSSPALAPTAASAPAPAHPAPTSNGRSRTNGHASPADSGTSQALKKPAPTDTGTARAPAQPADTGTARVAAQPAPTDTASSRVLKPSSPADTGSARNLASPASTTGAARALALDPALVTLEMLPFVKLRSGGRTRRFEVL